MVLPRGNAHLPVNWEKTVKKKEREEHAPALSVRVVKKGLILLFDPLGQELVEDNADDGGQGITRDGHLLADLDHGAAQA